MKKLEKSDEKVLPRYQGHFWAQLSPLYYLLTLMTVFYEVKYMHSIYEQWDPSNFIRKIKEN